MFELFTFLAAFLIEIIEYDSIVSFLNWLRTDFWNFSRSFFYGSLGGGAAVLMSHVQNESPLTDLKNHFIISLMDKRKSIQNNNSTDTSEEDKISEALKKISTQSNAYILKTTYAHLLVGGISGMIAVSAFNPKADELQTFSIAIIAGVSGFAFLKKSALIDDGNSDNLTNVEIASLKSLESYLKSVTEVSDITTTFTSDTHENQTVPTDGQEEIPDRTPDGNLETFITDLRTEIPTITEGEIEYVRELSKEGLSIVEILERLYNKEK